MLSCFNKKKNSNFQILYIIVGPLICPASLKRFVFYKVPRSDKNSLLWLANWHSALRLAEHHKPRWKCNAPYNNYELQLSKLKTVNNVHSFTISSSPRGEQSRVTDTMMLVCVCKQAVIKTISDVLYTPLRCDPVSCSLSLSRTQTHTHTHTHTRSAKLRIWTVNSKYLI